MRLAATGLSSEIRKYEIVFRILYFKCNCLILISISIRQLYLKTSSHLRPSHAQIGTMARTNGHECNLDPYK